MKIDIHTHTKKIKQGDSPHRNIDSETFKSIIEKTNVSVLAITNHNHFDKQQFNEFSQAVKDSCKLWPGVELDVEEDGIKAHMLIIVSPHNKDEFEKRLIELINDEHVDSFTATLEEIVSAFEELTPIYIAHYGSKARNLNDTDLEKLGTLIKDERRIIKEASNSISAGIYISHGHNSIYGSDVSDWRDYDKLALSLPELRLPVESFEQFVLLLQKDEPTINTLLDKKTKIEVLISPFKSAAETLKLNIYNDINIIFGSKGTGKSEILTALAKHFSESGQSAKVYKTDKDDLEKIHDLKGNELEASFEGQLYDCENELKLLKTVQDKSVTSPSSYVAFYEFKESNKNSQKFKAKLLSPLDDSSHKRLLNKANDFSDDFENLKNKIKNNDFIEDLLEGDDFESFMAIYDKILIGLKKKYETSFIEIKSIELLNNFIKKINEEVTKKTGGPEKPTGTGFKEFAINRIKIDSAVTEILNQLDCSLESEEFFVGKLGGKGELKCRTDYKIQNGDFRETNFSRFRNGINKSKQQEIGKKLSKIINHIYRNSLFEKISELKEIDSFLEMDRINELVQFRRYFTLKGKEYKPSTGESSMVLLTNELNENKEIYLIDEPEKSLGNDYISEVVVPILKGLAQRRKKVIIATHDANIAVRTLPYTSIYRGHDSNGYFTFIGNPFSDNLICLNNDRGNLNWKEISMKTLEGGKDAFGERTRIYG